MLEALGVSKVFGSQRALDTVSLRVEPGEIYCLLGANGAGKTTLGTLKLVEHADPLGDRHFSYSADKALWAQIPRFDYRTPTVSFAWRAAWLSATVLVITLLLSAAAALALTPRRPL